MHPRRLALLLVPVSLALTACGSNGGGEREQRDDRGPALGFELALAGTHAGSEAAAAPLVDLTPEQLAARLAEGNVRLIDVRTAEEVATGVIPGAQHIPLDQFDPAKLDLSDGRAVVLYCRSGRRSEIAGAKLAAALGQSVEHLAGGILAWEAAGQPVEQR